MARFSKAAMLQRLEARMESLSNLHGFKAGDGWASVEDKDTLTKVEFGQFCECRELIDDINSGLD